MTRYSLMILSFKYIMAEGYTLEEYTDMILIYGEAFRNGHQASRLYQERFPYRRHPSGRIFASVERRLREKGTLKHSHSKVHKIRRKVRTYKFEEEVLRRYRDEPSKSAKDIAHAMGVDHLSVEQVLHEHFHLYQPQKIEEMEMDNCDLRANFCRWFIEQAEEEPYFVHSILFTDESTFIIEDSKNDNVLAEVKSRTKRVKTDQNCLIVNVWAGIIDDHLIGPYILPTQISGKVYLTFLQETLPALLEDVSFEVRRRMWFQNCGLSPYFSFTVREYLNKTFGNKWIGRAGPVAWPPRSPDLTPVDFFLWRHLKSLVYETPVNTKEELVRRIMAASKTIRETPGIFEKVRQNMIRRYKSCNEVDDCHFEQFL